MSDLFGTLGTKYNIERFKKEVARARIDGCELRLVIEVTYSTINKGYNHPNSKGKRMVAIMGEAMTTKLATFDMKHHLQYWAFDGRKEMKKYIEKTFFAMGRHYDV